MHLTLASCCMCLCDTGLQTIKCWGALSFNHTALMFVCTAAAIPSTKGSRCRTSDASRSDVGSSRLGRLAPSAAGDVPGGAQAGSAGGPSSSRDTGSIKRDYIREQRETKELLKRWVACWVADLEHCCN
jgi:hypothetical protein